MFSEVKPKFKEYILSQGEIEFFPLVKFMMAHVLTASVKHDAVFIYHKGGRDRLGEFYLTLAEGIYEMTCFRFVGSCGPGLKLFMLELILKSAIKDAAFNKCSYVMIECAEPLMTDALMACHFSITKLDDQEIDGKPVYRGIKCL